MEPLFLEEIGRGVHEFEGGAYQNNANFEGRYFRELFQFEVSSGGPSCSARTRGGTR